MLTPTPGSVSEEDLALWAAVAAREQTDLQREPDIAIDAATILALIAIARRAPDWIPSDERLPAIFARRTRFEGALTWVFDDGRRIVPDPKFWMPLPEPPV